MTPITRSNREHSFDWELAVIVGLEKAILLKNISYWCEENRRRAALEYFQHGTWWTRESLKTLARKYPYFTMPSISRWMNQLCAAGWVRMFGQSGGTNFYAPGAAFDAWNLGEDWKVLTNSDLRAPSQNENPSDLLKMRTPVSQNEKGGGLKMRNRGSQNEKHEYKDIEYQIDVDVECGARSQKPTASTSRRKSDTSMPSSGAARPTTFADSIWATATTGAFATALHDYDPATADADAGYYRNRCRDWSAQNPGKPRNWIAFAAQIIGDDRTQSKLVTLNSANHDSDRHTLLTNPLTGNTTNLERVSRAAASAQRVIARRRAAGL